MDITVVLEKLGFDWRMALFNLVNFLIVFGILYKLFFKKVGEVIEERQKTVSSSVENAERLESEIQAARAKADTLITEAKMEATKILEEGNKLAEVHNEEMRQETQKQIEDMLSKTKKQISDKKDQMYKELRGQISDLVIMTTEKLLRKNIDKSAEDNLIDDLLVSSPEKN